VITTAADMSRWLEFHLNTGRDSAGNQLLPVSYWLQMHSPQITLGRVLFPVVRPWFPVSDIYSAYGLGWRLGLYRGTSVRRSCYRFVIRKLLFITVLPPDAMLARYTLSVCLSVRLSVTRRYCTETAKRRITQTIPHETQREFISIAPRAVSLQ